MESFHPQDRSTSTARMEHLMPLMNVVFALIAVGVLLWLVNRFIPMQGSIKSSLNAVVVVVVALWVCNLFGLFHTLSRYRIGQ
jgi:hydrogenase-4 membrane subunit HyfE